MEILVKIKKEDLDKIAESVAEAVAEKLYYEFLLLRYIPEIEAVKKGEVKGVGIKELYKILEE